MIEGLFHAHSGLRYLILLVSAIAIVNYAIALSRDRAPSSLDRILMSVFTGLLDLQLLLGVGMVVGGILYPALIGHIATMALAVAVAHGAGVLARKAADARKTHAMRLAGVLGALVLILGGIMSIGRSVFGSGAPTL
jgi:hypothetical protein